MVEQCFARFERLGMVARLGLHVPPHVAELGIDTQQATSVTLTPLGTWWLQRTLTQFGLRAPLVGELASASAAELSDGLDGYPVEAAEAELAGWSAVRGPEEAARQLALLLGDADVSRRQFALRALDGMPVAEYAVRPLLDDPAARAYARHWLETHGNEVAGPIEPHDELLIFVDIAAMMITSVRLTT